MTPDRYARLSDLFLAVAERPPDEHPSLLDRLCGDDVGLRCEVEALLARDAVRAALDTPLAPTQVRDAVSIAQQGPLLPESIGRYRIIGVLGQGGMGTVYRARQIGPDREVALKVLSGAALSPELQRRFEFETQVLARLNHPGIAQIYEAGVAEDGGRRIPYFAMELIDGAPLTQYAADRGLGTRDRLRLLLSVCDGVRHAHQKGVIHRDLKPANILVTEEGTKGRRDEGTQPTSGGPTSSLRPYVPASLSFQPKILDFGVARAVDSDVAGVTLLTSAGQLVGTLPYMSPEQLAGDPAAVDTRCDVYALGVIAYELLTGRLPHDVRGRRVTEAVRLLRDSSVTRLGSIDRALRGDIDTIVARALEKDREHRYPSVSDLAADIEHFLRDEPIVARPTSVMYQLRKFARRNRGLVGTVAAAFLLLIAGVAGTGYGLWQAARGWSLAEQRLQRALGAESDASRKRAEAEAVGQFLARILMSAAPQEQGREVTVIQALDAARQQVEDAFPDQPACRAAVYAELGAVNHNLGRPQEALIYLRKACELRRELLGDGHPETVQSICNLGLALVVRDDPVKLAEAETLLTLGLEKTGAVYGDDSSEVAEALGELAAVYWHTGDLDRAENLCGEALKIIQARGELESTRGINLLVNLAMLSGRKGDLEAKVVQLRKLVDTRCRLRGAEHPETLETTAQLAEALIELDRNDEAEALYRRTIDAQRRVLGEDHVQTLMCQHHFALCLYMLGRPAESEALLRETLARARATLGPDHPLTLAPLSLLSEVLFRTGRYAEAHNGFIELVERSAERLGPNAAATLERRIWIGLCAAEQGRLTEARDRYDEAQRLIRPNDPAHADLPPLLTVARAKLLWTGGRFDAAEQALSQIEEAWRARFKPLNVNMVLVWTYLAQLHDAWHAAEPGRGSDARAAEWRTRLASGPEPGPQR